MQNLKLPGTWNLQEVMSLYYYKNTNQSIVKQCLENYSCLRDLLTGHLPPKLGLIFRQDELFKSEPPNVEKDIEKKLDTCQELGINIYSYWDEEYPKLLREIDLPPVLLYVRGTLQATDSASVAIVGKRKCSRYGEYCSQLFAEGMTNAKIIVTSGMAEGVDQYAHRKVMQLGGVTYAVVASALDCILPKTKEEFARKIIDSGGAVISEYLPGTKALPAYFLQRNRIISGISKATIVVESAIKGGGLNTAKFALDQSREVYAVPGNITSEKSKGTNLLIKKSIAAPALSPGQIIAELGFADKSPELLLAQENGKPATDDPTELKILSTFDEAALHIDEISRRSEIDIPSLLVVLLDMEFKGLVRQMPGKNYVKV